MELPRLPKFKLQLLALISETRDLRERERSLSEELHLSSQRQREAELEFGRRLRESQQELAMRTESQQKLEIKLNVLENDNLLMERKQKELQETIDGLLQSKESFLRVYEGSTSQLKLAIAVKDRKLAVLSDKLHTHRILFDSIENEAIAVKHTVDNVQQLMIDKEKVVVELKEKTEKISELEKTFVEKICFVENKLRNCQKELHKKDSSIISMKEQLEMLKNSGTFLPNVEHKILLSKDETIKSLKLDKQALRHELQSLEFVLKRIQGKLSCISTEDKNLTSMALTEAESQRTVAEDTSRLDRNSSPAKENALSNHLCRDYNENSVTAITQEEILKKANSNVAMILKPEHYPTTDNSVDDLARASCLSEDHVYRSPKSLCSCPQSQDDINDSPERAKEGKSTPVLHQSQNDEGSTEDVKSFLTSDEPP